MMHGQKNIKLSLRSFKQCYKLHLIDKCSELYSLWRTRYTYFFVATLDKFQLKIYRIKCVQHEITKNL